MSESEQKQNRMTDEEIEKLITAVRTAHAGEEGIQIAVLMINNGDQLNTMVYAGASNDIAHCPLVLQRVWAQKEDQIMARKRLEEMTAKEYTS